MSTSFADDGQRYRLDSRIATGGMGEVWRATDTALGREVAVKLLKAEFADDAVFRSRFETEARHAAALHHPGIAGVFDVGEARASDGSGHPRPFLVMELVEGQPLSALLARGGDLDPVAVRDLMAQVGDALGAAHRAGIIHRDVKPANLIVTPDGRVKVTDFGIARAADGVGITRTGAVMGTPQYLSPEQAEGKPATPASDVYALGVVSFECLAGRRPFEAESAVATALAHIREPIPELPARVPADLAAVVRRALAKDPAQRYPDGSAFAAALRDPASEPTRRPVVVPPVPVAPDEPATQVLTSTPAPPATPVDLPPVDPPSAEQPRRRSTGPLIALVVLLLALAVVITLLLTRSDDDEPEPTTPTTGSSAPTDTASSPSQTATTPSATTETPTTYQVVSDTYLGQPCQNAVNDLQAHQLRTQVDPVDNDGTHIEGTVASVNPTGEAEPHDLITIGCYGAAPAPPTSSAPDSPTITDPPTTPSDPATSPSDPSGTETP